MCNSPPIPAPQPPPVVDVGWLAAALGAATGRPLVFDASFYLPAEATDPQAMFRRGHIPGARFFDIETIADPDSDLPHMVPALGRFEKLVGALGIAPGQMLVFYDQKGLFSAARGWWLMRLFGHASVAVLDGGLPAWQEAGHAVESGAPPAATPQAYRGILHAGRLRGLGDMVANLASPSALVLDARAAGRFAGSVPEPRAGLRAGHIPGARNLPFTELLGPDQRLLPPDALRARLAAAGADGSRPVVVSCGTGVTAAILALAMAQAGLPEAALYDGSWTEWGSRPELPVEC